MIGSITRTAHLKILKVHYLVNLACSAAAGGVALQGAVVRRSAGPPYRTTTTIASASAW